ncbi:MULTISPECIES: M28 family peptidase [Actinoalloteichus]|uniref:PA domain-containing protein n=1 Tax=Actinoalloteichus fjordicus TaxID=1612552 RepID=A0AAC9LG85_9PSEU|nr:MULTISPECIES: M28 family peptidase [Actinoalloteichus]APU16290.1 PA domain-containing protein [Actinoalloteichus fjordicus]APU22350.1 PA domain-containing protein [Actinoalloteichus sp. GBA129-24]
MSGLKRRDLIGGAAALAAFAMVGATTSNAFAAPRVRPGAGSAPTLGLGDRAVAASVDARRALTHIQHLAGTIGPRIGGTESEHRAADYAAARFEELGYQVTRQPFPVADKYLADLVLPDGERWQASASPQGAFDTEVQAAVVDVRGGGVGNDTDYSGRDVTGQFALIDHRTADRDAQVRGAVERGAAGVLLIAASADPERKAGAFLPTLAAPVGVPVLGLGQAHGEWLRRRLVAGPVRLRVIVTAHTGLTSYNVLAERPASLPAGDEVVMVGAHYDSVPGSPGANDDASGSALCLELARVLRRLPTQKALRFALWGSEEQGLIGSRYYVNQLDDHAAGRIAACFQNDMVATSHPPADLYWLLSVDGADNLATATVAQAASRLGYLADVAGPTARGGSDHVPFHERGIAAANFSWRGEAGPHLLEPVYHTPEDTVAGNVSNERLQVSLELVGSAVYEVARAR